MTCYELEWHALIITLSTSSLRNQSFFPITYFVFRIVLFLFWSTWEIAIEEPRPLLESEWWPISLQYPHQLPYPIYGSYLPRGKAYAVEMETTTRRGRRCILQMKKWTEVALDHGRNPNISWEYGKNETPPLFTLAYLWKEREEEEEKREERRREGGEEEEVRWDSIISEDEHFPPSQWRHIRGWNQMMDWWVLKGRERGYGRMMWEGVNRE